MPSAAPRSAVRSSRATERIPQTEEELEWADWQTAEMIRQEPW